MVSRKFVFLHQDSTFDIDYDTDDGFEVLKFQLFSLTSVPPDRQKIMAGDDQIVSDDADLAAISDKLRLISIDNEQHIEGQVEVKPELDFLTSDEELARLLQAEEDALMMQQTLANENKEQVESRIRPYISQVLMYEDLHRQEEARKTVPVEKLEEKAAVALAREGKFKPTKNEEDHAFLLQLLFWFKQSFRWVNAPPCDNCGNETLRQGMGTASPSEIQYGASRVELYRCNSCKCISRFPRYNDPLKLLETRKGRCGEWANCFTLYCRAFGYESRLVLDFTDHVWTECFSPSLRRWMHLDPCEGIYDNPLLYEKGWNKKLTYVIAVAKDGVYDVTKRYTRNWHEVLGRRNMTTETALSSILASITEGCRKLFTSVVLAALDERDRNESEALERDLYANDSDSVVLPGRQSGNKEWRISRSEHGSDSWGSSSCPVRKCIDEHVTVIYNAFFSVMSKLVEERFSKSGSAEVLLHLKKTLVNLKNSPFRARKTSINSVSNGQRFNKLLLSFNQLFDALSLKIDSDVTGRIGICLASDPVRTSIALPIVFHALDDLINHVNSCDTFGRSSLAWPLLKLNRICSGLVLASGEELPFGIATSAFDGTRMSKWEEPNGAKGCWIIYQSSDNQFHELVAYELMSANDAPERDPKDWIVEGSSDGGLNWRVLDVQTSQTFEERFQRRAYMISTSGYQANAFRLRFLAVRDAKATSRFQIGSIDLYSKTSPLP